MNKQTRILFTLCTLVTLFANSYASLILDENKSEPASDKASNLFTFLGNAKPKIDALDDSIFKKDHKSLIKWAITAEAHHFVQTKLNNKEPSEAWIYNRISKLSNADLEKYILNMAKIYPELDSSSALDAFASEYGITEEIVNFVAKKPSKNSQIQSEESTTSTVKNTQKNKKNRNHDNKDTNGVYALLANGDRLNLIKWGLTAESHLHNKSKKIAGGLFEYIHTLSNEKIAKYITIAAKNHSELNNKEKIEELAKKYGITAEIVMEKHSKGEPEPVYEDDESHSESSNDKKSENLHDIIARGDRKTLIKWALITEALLNLGSQGKLVGGLHDYINTLSNQQLGKFISVGAKNHPELNNKQNMEKLDEEFEINQKEIIRENKKEKEKNDNTNKCYSKKKVTDKFLNRGSINFSLFINEDKDDLFSWALAAEKYDKEKNNLYLLEGGLENYIMQLNKEQLADNIVIKTGKYPELADKNYLESLARRYGFKKL